MWRELGVCDCFRCVVSCPSHRGLTLLVREPPEKKNYRAESYRAFRVPADWLSTTVSLLLAAAETRLHLEIICTQNASQTRLEFGDNLYSKRKSNLVSVLNNTELVCCGDTMGTLSCRMCLRTQQPSQHTKEHGWRFNPL